MRKLIWICLIFPFFGMGAQENMLVDSELAQRYSVLNKEELSPYKDGKMAFFKKGTAYTTVLNENLEKTNIKPAPELDSLGIEGRFAYDASLNKIYFSKGGELYSSVWKKDKWDTPQPIEFARIKSERQTLRGSSIAYSGWRYKPEDVKIKGQKFANPTLSSDGKTLYYAAELPGTIGGSDIWYSTLEKDGTWSIPVNLGENVNTASNENTPFLVGDTVLFFTSATPQNMRFVLLNSNQKSSSIAALIEPKKPEEVKTEPVTEERPALADANELSSNTESTSEKSETKPENIPALADLNEASSKVYLKDPETCVFLFDYDKDQMIGSYQEEIDVLLQFINHHKNSKFLIVGYTDERGSEAYNQTLSEKRAKKLYQILVEKGISKEKLKYAGKGKADPIVRNAKTEDEHQKNRRVEIQVLN